MKRGTNQTREKIAKSVDMAGWISRREAGKMQERGVYIFRENENCNNTNHYIIKKEKLRK